MKDSVKKRILKLLKIFGIIMSYLIVLIVSVFFTMKSLIKGEEIAAPALIGKNLEEASKIAAQHKVYLKKITGNYDRRYDPLTVINQVPSPGVRIKERSFIKIFITSDVVEVIVPDLCGYNLNDCEKLLSENSLRKRYVSYMDAEDVPVDFVIAQSYPPGTRVPTGTEIDILLSRGAKDKSYIMPDVIGQYASDVKAYFISRGLKILENQVHYPGLEPGLVVKQYPLSGYPINAKARISIGVSISEEKEDEPKSHISIDSIY
ncbi:MAG: PASTA domain-containing protein [Candidatus Aminicenantes bacterium]|nr:MAG: PASTA domain-containing protein [Candidatus Aminicenantes bacterium]